MAAENADARGDNIGADPQKDPSVLSAAIAAQLNDAVWLASPNLAQIAYVNPAFEELWGCVAEDVYKSPQILIEGVHPDDRHRVLSAMSDERKDWLVEFRVRMADGSDRQVEARGFSVTSGPGDELRGGSCRELLERIGNQVALVKSEALLADAGRLARLGGWDHDVETSEGSWTETVFEIFELPVGEMPSLEDRVNLVHVDDRPRFQAAIQQAIENGISYDIELRAVTAKGNLLHIRNIGQPLMVDGKVVSVSGFVQDITERVESQNALAKSEALWAGTGRLALLGGWELDVETSERTWTDAIFDIFEIDDDEEPLLEDAINFFHPEDQLEFREAFQNALDNGDPYDLEVRVVTAKGNTIFVRTTGQAEFYDGKVVRLSGFLQDISGRVRNQTALARSKALLTETGQLAGLGGWELDAETSEVVWTDTLFDIFEMPVGVAPSLAAGIDACPSEYRPILRSAVAEALENGVPYDLEMRVFTAKGKPIHIRTTGQPEFEDGKLIRLSGFLQDVTERVVQAERLREAFVATIEAMVRAIETRDPYTAAHQRNVSQLGAAIARGLGLPQEDVNAVLFGSMIHDIGKIAVPSQILNKPGKLNEIEFKMVKGHSRVGFDIISEIEYPWPVAEIVLQHHERLDGSGYPNGLRGDEISQLAQIVCVADVVEAMTAHRPYRPALGIEMALEEIIKNRGTLFDPDVVDVCVRLIREEHFEFDEN